jgi:hypothetical protein
MFRGRFHNITTGRGEGKGWGVTAIFGKISKNFRREEICKFISIGEETPIKHLQG